MIPRTNIVLDPRPSRDMQARLLSVPDTAHILGISRSHAYRLVERGDLPSVRLGRRILVPLAAVRSLTS